ncbi:hypothetical protein [Paenibacillus elgii]|uniref:hypothetical protein n=1 Tax=Paenibacillus elgii TaxID=189691 RepID=UPI000248D219|nr:hypothetical protein [Paenibacillus elgii]
MTIEQNIKDVIATKLNDGTIEKLVGEQFEKCVNNALDNLFRSYGDITKTIEKQLMSTITPMVEAYDFSEYLVKLDTVLTDVLKNTTQENKALLNNFKKFYTSEAPKQIKTSELFDKWMNYVEENVETDGLEVDYDDEPTYEYVPVTFEVQHDEGRSWSSLESASLIFECEHDEEMNFMVKIKKWKDSSWSKWNIERSSVSDIKSLRNINEFEVFLNLLAQSGTEIVIDVDSDDGEVRPEQKPEATFS